MSTQPTPDNGYGTVGEALRAAESGQTVLVVDGRYYPSYADSVRILTSPTLIELADRLDELVAKLYPGVSIEAEPPELVQGREAHSYFLEMINLQADLRALAQP